MKRFGLVKLAWVVACGAACVASGCGTTRWTDTSRTATEQLLVSDAIDRAVNEIDFHPLADKEVYFDATYLKGVVDEGYLVSSLRQRMLSSGCILKIKREDATYIIEPRAGVVGTNRHDLLYGVPATNLPSFVPVPGIPSQIPEIPFAKRTNQQGVAKIAVFAYNRETGMLVWQSGIANQMSRAKDFWVLGAGPFQRGTIYKGTAFAGQTINNPLTAWLHRRPDENKTAHGVEVGTTRIFAERLVAPDRKDGGTKLAGKPKVERKNPKVKPANSEVKPMKGPTPVPPKAVPLSPAPYYPSASPIDALLRPLPPSF